jgi:hypothetical protein
MSDADDILTDFDHPAVDGLLEEDMERYHCEQCGNALVLPRRLTEAQKECYAVYLDTAHIPRRCGGHLTETPEISVQLDGKRGGPPVDCGDWLK